MAYGHAERNLALIRQLEAETRQLLGSHPQLNREQSGWLEDAVDRARTAGLLAPPRVGSEPAVSR
jgi:hypothetical protein